MQELSSRFLLKGALFPPPSTPPGPHFFSKVLEPERGLKSPSPSCVRGGNPESLQRSVSAPHSQDCQALHAHPHNEHIEPGLLAESSPGQKGPRVTGAATQGGTHTLNSPTTGLSSLGHSW